MNEKKKERGIWFEAARNRYRVRLYRRGRIVHLSYHADAESAAKAYEEAKAEVERIREAEKRYKNNPGLLAQAEALGLNAL